MFAIDGTKAVREVPPMEEVSGDASPVFSGGDWHDLLHQGVPYCPGDLSNNPCHGAHSHTIAESYGAVGVSSGQESAKTTTNNYLGKMNKQKICGEQKYI